MTCVRAVFDVLVSSPLSVASTWGKNRHVRFCGNIVGEEKSVWLFCGLDAKKSDAESGDECELELAPAPGPHILSFIFTRYSIGHEIGFSHPYGIIPNRQKEKK